MLTPDSTRTERGLIIKEKILLWKGPIIKANQLLSGGSGKVQGITIHNTADLPGVEDDAEQYTRATWNGNMRDVRVHYYVDDLGAWQNLQENEVGWHAADGMGPGNETTIAIEIIMDGSGSAEDKKAEENGALLAAILLDRYGLDMDRLYTHNHWMGQPDSIVQGAGKNCPLYILPHWKSFKEKVKEHMKMQGVLYIGDFTSRVETGMISLFLERGGHTCDVVPYGSKWGVLVTALADGVTKAELQKSLQDFGKIYSTDPAMKK